MNPILEEERDQEIAERDSQPSEMDEALKEYWSDHHEQEWTP
jgi:hypothetical protein